MTTNKHRYSMSDLPVVEQEKWGRSKADKLAGPLQYRDGAKPPRDASQVQGCGDPASAGVPADRSFNDVSNRGWLRGAGEDATKRPGYIPGGGRAKR
jgi:hypothetical protein